MPWVAGVAAAVGIGVGAGVGVGVGVATTVTTAAPKLKYDVAVDANVGTVAVQVDAVQVSATLVKLV